MKISDVQKEKKKDVILSVRTTQEFADWIKKHNISPSLLFNKAIEELQKQEDHTS